MAALDSELLSGYARLCGTVLARAHVKTGNGAKLTGYLGTGDAMPEAIAEFATTYADRTEQDHASFLKAIKSGKLPVGGVPEGEG